MKRDSRKRIHAATAIIALGAGVSLPSVAWAQASAAQPGAPAPEMNTNTPPVLVAPSASSPAADTAASTGAGPADIIVTATHASTRLQQTPLAITVTSGESLRSRQVDNISALSENVPGMQIGKSLGFVRIAIRGVGLDPGPPGAEGRVAYHVDGVYISRPREIAGTFLDIDRIEVVRGPQGTLYGRNATGGALNLITNEPVFKLGGFAQVGYGNYDTFRSEGAVNVPLSDTVAVRLAAETIEQNKGYGRNEYLGTDIADQHSRSVRGKIRFRPSDAVDLILTADYSHTRDHNNQDALEGPGNPNLVPIGNQLGGTRASEARDVNGDLQALNRQTYWGLSAHADIDLGFAKLTSITAYRHGRYFQQKDQDQTQVAAVPFRGTENSHQISQEVRLAGDHGILDWQIGGFYYKDRVEGVISFSPFMPSVAPPVRVTGIYVGGTLRTTAYAGFGQLSFHLTPELTLTAGGRYSHEKAQISDFSSAPFLFRPYNPAVPIPLIQRTAQKTFHNFSPKVSLDYKPNSRTFLYVTYSEGFKSGNYSVGSLAPPFASETLKDYETGVKVDWLDGHLRTNLSAFYYDYTNLQIVQSNPTGSGTLTVLNAKGAKIKGVEAEIIAYPAPDLQVGFSGALIDTKYDTLFIDNPRTAAVDPRDLAGNHLTQAPGYTVNANIQYTVHTNHGSFTPRAEVVALGRTYFSPYNFKDVLTNAPYAKENLFLNYASEDGRWTGSLYVRNVTNKRTRASSAIATGLYGSGINTIFDPPRTYGVSAGLRF